MEMNCASPIRNSGSTCEVYEATRVENGDDYFYCAGIEIVPAPPSPPPTYSDYSIHRDYKCQDVSNPLGNKDSAESCRNACVEHATDNGYHHEFCCSYDTQDESCRVSQDGSSSYTANNNWKAFRY